MKKYNILSSLLVLTILVSAISCGIKTQKVDASVKEAPITSSSEQIEKPTEDVPKQLIAIAKEKNGNSMYYNELSIFKFIDDGCTYYVAYAMTSTTDGGLSTSIVHSASCNNPIHKEK